MYPAALPVRTHDAEASFTDMLGEQLRAGPWLVGSALAHALLFLLLWLLFPAEAVKRATNSVAVVPDAEVVQPVVLPTVTPPTVLPDPDVLPDPIAAPEPTQLDNADSSPSTDFADAAAPDASSSVLGLMPTSRFGPPGRPGSPSGSGPGGRGDGMQSAIDPALDWLARHQDPDGKWDCDGFMKHDTNGDVCGGPGNPVHDVGVTGLALLAFLGDGHTMRSGRHRDVVKKGVLWLRAQQQENGLFGSAAASDFVYDHAIAAYAMSEAYGLSAYETLRPVAQRGIDYLQAHRNPYGAWRYQPRDGDNDTSITGWCILAMCSAEHFGLTVDRNALRIAATWMASCGSPDGHLGYQRAGEPSARRPGDHGTRFPTERTDALTAVWLFCRFFLGDDPKEHPVMHKSGERLRARLPKWDEKAGSIDFYYWYYGTYALHQLGGTAWREWSAAIGKAVVATQRTDGNARGSWDPVDAWGEDGGRVYSTAILTLVLQAHRRYGRLIPGSR